MKQEDYGFNPETGIHSQVLTRAESLFLGILWTDHVGADSAISADELAVRFGYAMTGIDYGGEEWHVITLEVERAHPAYLNSWKRWVRKMHNHILEFHEKIPVLSKAGAGGGYWIASDDAEVRQFYGSFIRRAVTGFRKANGGKKAGMVEFFTQLTFDDLSDLTGTAGGLDPDDLAAPEDVVDAFLEKMLADPAKFSGSLKKIRDKFGSVLIPKGMFEAMRSKAAEFQGLLEEMGV